MLRFRPTTRRLFPAAFAAAALLTGVIGCTSGSDGSEQAAAQEITVYKTATCGCCNAWVEHLRNAGFSVTAHDVGQDQLNNRKQAAGLPYDLASCHTAHVDGYTIEGHVPAADIRRLLEERPDAAGLTVPGMPVGSPGMEHGDRRDPYDVLIFDEDSNTEVFTSHNQ